MAQSSSAARVVGPDKLAQAATWLLQGDIVGVPTESVYGLSVCAHNALAVARLRALKGREAHKPMPLVAADEAVVQKYFFLPDGALGVLYKHFWPGPLTVGLTPRGPLAEGLVGTDGTAGVRISAHPVLQALCAAADGLLTATSANFAGEAPVARLGCLPPSLLRACRWLDGGTLAGCAPSTVVLPGPHGRIRMVREGAISKQALAAVVGAHVLC